jgi:hypothetical protein
MKACTLKRMATSQPRVQSYCVEGEKSSRKEKSQLWPSRDSATKLAPQPEHRMRIGGSEETLTTAMMTEE